MRHDLLDHLRTHEKDRWTLIHINSYTYITHTKRALDISLPFQDASFPSYSPPLFRDIHFVSLLPCNDSDIFATDGRREYTCKYMLYLYFTWCTGDASSCRCFRLVVVPLVTEEKREGRESTKRETTSYEFRFNIFFLIFFFRQ